MQTIKERDGEEEGEGEGEVKDYLYITYGVDNQRIEGNWYKDGNPTQTKIYLGDYEIVIPDEDDTKEIHYIAAPTGLVAVMLRQNDTDKLYYACTDHLGSLTALVNEAGQVVERHSYDAWGRERNPDDWEEYVEPNNGGLLAYGYGYTGHEMLPEFGLINMNGRVYDPVLGRFLSPDNYVQDPFNPQNYNRFGYCYNNPLRYTDPDGEFALIPLLLSLYITGVQTNLFNGGNPFNPLNWNWSNPGMYVSMASSFVTTGIGKGFGGFGSFGNEMLRAGAHGLWGGISSVANGGSFWQGFGISAVSSLVGSGMQALGAGPVAPYSGLAGAGIAWATGADPIGGFWQGYGVGALNHDIIHSRKINDNWYERTWDDGEITYDSNETIFTCYGTKPSPKPPTSKFGYHWWGKWPDIVNNWGKALITQTGVGDFIPWRLSFLIWWSSSTPAAALTPGLGNVNIPSPPAPPVPPAPVVAPMSKPTPPMQIDSANWINTNTDGVYRYHINLRGDTTGIDTIPFVAPSYWP